MYLAHHFRSNHEDKDTSDMYEDDSNGINEENIQKYTEVKEKWFIRSADEELAEILLESMKSPNSLYRNEALLELGRLKWRSLALNWRDYFCQPFVLHSSIAKLEDYITSGFYKNSAGNHEELYSHIECLLHLLLHFELKPQVSSQEDFTSGDFTVDEVRERPWENMLCNSVKPSIQFSNPTGGQHQTKGPQNPELQERVDKQGYTYIVRLFQNIANGLKSEMNHKILNKELHHVAVFAIDHCCWNLLYKV
ncbi:hypothetical protein BDQ17DRAFT_1335713 [Cyathus striatus]|nr:hypothetical protein BDQ17DRAFT_1335713 [Cyathus striatus]